MCDSPRARKCWLRAAATVCECILAAVQRLPSLFPKTKSREIERRIQLLSQSKLELESSGLSTVCLSSYLPAQPTALVCVDLCVNSILIPEIYLHVQLSWPQFIPHWQVSIIKGAQCSDSSPLNTCRPHTPAPPGSVLSFCCKSEIIHPSLSFSPYLSVLTSVCPSSLLLNHLLRFPQAVKMTWVLPESKDGFDLF